MTVASEELGRNEGAERAESIRDGRVRAELEEDGSDGRGDGGEDAEAGKEPSRRCKPRE